MQGISTVLGPAHSPPERKKAQLFKGLLEEGYYFHGDSKPAVKAFSTVYASAPLSSTFGMPTIGWSAFPEMAITTNSISWKPKRFPNCLKSHCEKEVSIDWNMRGNNPKFIILFLFINLVRWDWHTQSCQIYFSEESHSPLEVSRLSFFVLSHSVLFICICWPLSHDIFFPWACLMCFLSLSCYQTCY